MILFTAICYMRGGDEKKFGGAGHGQLFLGLA
jgi:hypothetical protein